MIIKTSILLRPICALSLAAWAGSFYARAENTAAVNELLKLKEAGVNEETILSFIHGKSINYDLSADNILVLRDQGVAVAVLNAMVVSAWKNCAGGHLNP